MLSMPEWWDWEHYLVVVWALLVLNDFLEFLRGKVEPEDRDR